eukprot:XP_001708804.1 Hypothetical protein GL50803_117114 [Giardia lamblia ATCC 50803]
MKFVCFAYGRICYILTEFGSAMYNYQQGSVKQIVTSFEGFSKTKSHSQTST